jgi:hypothetical protein
MANKQTRRTRTLGEFATYKKTCGRAVNSSEERRAAGRDQYKAPTIVVKYGEPVHPVSGLTLRQMAAMQP